MEATTIIKPAADHREGDVRVGHEHNRYAFEVDRRATKPEIKRSAVEELYSVRVVSRSRRRTARASSAATSSATGAAKRT